MRPSRRSRGCYGRKETPDRASISTVGHTGPMIKGRQYELQCDIHKVAPVESLTVNWYKGDTLVENITITDSSKSPGNVSARLQISPSRDDDGAQYRCEAELGWNIDGTRPPLKVSSQVLGSTLHYGNRTIFWAVVGSFVGLALVMVLGYLLKKRTG